MHLLPSVARALFERACQHEPHGVSNRLPVLCLMLTLEHVAAGSGAVRVPSIDCSLLRMASLLADGISKHVPSPKVLAALRGLPLACQSALAAAFSATVLLGSTAARVLWH